ncbi:hypothetical protein [Patulibacter sp. SYSU D01012]|uniref:hypothetical protein n=1 Tax=Patulibacter sp. SYSU D01012 TaxID=2817381 RepID=UPI001B30462A|nr:hypothetical protein [Patulibacter sp. SYSU D01012]
MPRPSPVPSCRPRVAPLVRAAGAVALTAAALATPAAADVLEVDLGPGVRAGRLALSLTRTTPDGARGRLAPVPMPTVEQLTPTPTVRVRPAGDLLAVAAGAGVVLVPTDGGPIVPLRGVDASTGVAWPLDPSRSWRRPDGTFDDPGPVIAWEPDGAAFSVGPLRPRHGTAVRARCVVATRTCRVAPLRAGVPISALADGRLVLGSLRPRLLDRALGGDLRDPQPRSAAWIRRMRRLLRRPRADGLRLTAGAGRSGIVVDGARRPVTEGATVVEGQLPGGPASPAVLVVRRYRATLRTFRENGRRTAAVRVWGSRSERRLLVRPDGSVGALPEAGAHGVDTPTAPLPGGGWVGTRTEHDWEWQVPATIDAAGRARPVPLGGRVILPPRLHRALGLPPGDGPPARGFEDDGMWLQSVEVHGYEAATGSMVVSYDTADLGWVAARVPLDGRPPTAVGKGSRRRPDLVVW